MGADSSERTEVEARRKKPRRRLARVAPPATPAQLARVRAWKAANHERVLAHNRKNREIRRKLGRCLRCDAPALRWPNGKPKCYCAHHAAMSLAEVRAYQAANPEKRRASLRASDARRAAKRRRKV